MTSSVGGKINGLQKVICLNQGTYSTTASSFHQVSEAALKKRHKQGYEDSYMSIWSTCRHNYCTFYPTWVRIFLSLAKGRAIWHFSLPNATSSIQSSAKRLSHFTYNCTFHRLTWGRGEGGWWGVGVEWEWILMVECCRPTFIPSHPIPPIHTRIYPSFFLPPLLCSTALSHLCDYSTFSNPSNEALLVANCCVPPSHLQCCTCLISWRGHLFQVADGVHCRSGFVHSKNKVCITLHSIYCTYKYTAVAIYTLTQKRKASKCHSPVEFIVD